MKEIISNKIGKLVNDINEYIAEIERLESAISEFNKKIIYKQGAIFELKKLLEEVEPKKQE